MAAQAAGNNLTEFSWPALSKSLHRLERAAGAKLVRRTTKGVDLTAVGSALTARRSRAAAVKKPETSVGLLAPAKTPRPILNQISKEVARILNLPDIKERLQAMGFVPAPTTPEEFDTILRSQIEILSKLVRDTGLRAK